MRARILEIFEEDEKAIQKELEEQEKAAAERLRQRKNASIPEPVSEVFLKNTFFNFTQFEFKRNTVNFQPVPFLIFFTIFRGFCFLFFKKMMVAVS